MATIEGLPELLQALRRLPETLQKKVLADWATRNAKRAASAMAAAAPLGKTGNLRRGIKAKRTRKAKLTELGSLARAVATGFSPGRHFNIVNVGSKGRYAKKGKNIGRYAGPMPANPFAAAAARPVVEQARADVQQGLTQSVERALQAAVRRTIRRGTL